MRRLRPLLVAAVTLSLLAPVAVAHEGGDGMINIAASTGEPRVGELVDFTYYLLQDGRLEAHVDTDVRVTQNGAPLLALDSTHEHDGVHHASIRFVEPGPFSYTVVAETDDGPVERTLTGEVRPAGDRSDVEVRVDAPGRVEAGEPVEIGLDVRGPDDGSGATSEEGSSAVLLGGDGPDHRAWIRLYREPTGKLVRRAATGPTVGPSEALVTSVNVPGTYALQVEVYPSGDASFAPVVERRTIEVEPGTGPAAPDPTWDPVEGGAEDPGDGSLIVEVDPTTEVGPLADLKVNALLLDDGHPVPDVRYDVRIAGPRGATILAQQDSLSPGGIAEWFAHTPVPGTYGIEVAAAADGGTEREATASYTVLPPTMPGLPGTVEPTFDRILDGGGPHEMGLAFEDAAGQPMQHVEADLEAYAPGEEAPRWTTKLHTHDRDVAWTAAFGTSGGHYLKVNPSPQSPTAEKILAPGGPTAELGFGFHVDAPAPEPASADPADAPGEPTPWPAVLAVVALAAAAAVWRRRV